jgi:subtilisin family serine protease
MCLTAEATSVSLSDPARRARLNRASLLVLTAGLAVGATAFAAPLQLRAGAIDTSRPINALQVDDNAVLGLPHALVELRPSDRLVIQLDGPMTKQRRAAIDATGVRVQGYLPPNAFILTIPEGVNADAARNLDFVRWSAPYQPGWKVEPSLLGLEGALDVNISFFGDETEELAKNMLNTVAGVQVHSAGRNGREMLVTATVPANTLTQIAMLPGVQFVEPALEAVERNSVSHDAVQSGQSNQQPLWNNGLTGEGQVVGVQDSRINVNHCMFVDTVPVGPGHRKIVNYIGSLGASSHGTHVAGTIAGNRIGTGPDDDYHGVAYMAKIAYAPTPSFLNGAQFYSQLQTAHNFGARVHTNSWGADFRTDYNAWTRAIDEFSYDFEESLVVFAVTNQGSLYTPENAKSVLAVGASDRSFPNGINNHCTAGIGPTQDGRRKPEVYAPGCGIQSASSGSTCSLNSSSGTSMATPAISGAATLIRQYFTDGYYPTGVVGENESIFPTGALLRAVVLNSTRDMTGITGFPSNLEGWGRLVADDALYFPGDSRSMVVRDVRNTADEALSTGETYEFVVQVNGSEELFRATMAFTDPPAAAGAFNAVINDVNLVVESPSGTIYRGNAMSGGLSIPNTATVDGINSVEQVLVSSPEAGVWTIRVEAPAVNVGEQGFAIAVTGEVAEASTVDCTGDINGDNVVNFTDLNTVLAEFGEQTRSPADVDGSGTVDFTDLNIVLSNFGNDCN